MSSKALIKKYYDAFNAGDVGAMLDCLSPDIAHHVNEGGVRVGKDAFASFCAHMTRCYAEHLKDMVILVDDTGTRVAAEFTVHGTYLETDDGLPEAKGQTYVLPAGAFFTVEGDMITRVVTYYNLADWVRQVSV